MTAPASEPATLEPWAWAHHRRPEWEDGVTQHLLPRVTLVRVRRKMMSELNTGETLTAEMLDEYDISELSGLRVTVSYTHEGTGEKRELTGEINGVSGSVSETRSIHLINLDREPEIDDPYADDRQDGVKVSLKGSGRFVTLQAHWRDRHGRYVGRDSTVVVADGGKDSEDSEDSEDDGIGPLSSDGGSDVNEDGGDADPEDVSEVMAGLTEGESIEVVINSGQVVDGIVQRVGNGEVEIDPRDGITDCYILTDTRNVTLWREWWDEHESEPRDERVGMVESIHVAETDGGVGDA